MTVGVINFVEQLANKGLLNRVDIVGLFEGGADGSGLGEIVGTYKDQFGPISNVAAQLNGQERIMNITKGHPLRNIELAFLRAYSLYYGIEKLLIKHGVVAGLQQGIFVANEYSEIGRERRYGRVLLSISTTVGGNSNKVASIKTSGGNG